jgi:hypothetical protein
MALQVNFKVKTNTTRLYFDFYETTGQYSFPSNPGGYGAPNLLTTDIDYAKLIITKNGATTSYTVSMPIPPSTTGTLAIPVYNTDMGLTSTDKIPDGIYNIKYEVGQLVNGSEVPLSAMDYTVDFVEGLKCCLSKLRKNISIPVDNGCGCSDKSLEKVANAQALLDSICYLVGCDQIDRADAVISYLANFCSCNCSECD